MCPVCGGPGVYLGNLGGTDWYRYRNCGHQFTGDPPVEIVDNIRMIPGETRYTREELDRLYRKMRDAAIGDPGEEGG